MSISRAVLAVAALCAIPALACKSKPESSAPSPAPSASGPSIASASASASAPEAIPAPPDVGAPPADAEKTPSGLASKVLQPGTGKDHPSINDRVRAHYTGWTADGRMFDSTVARGQPTVFPVKAVIKGWSEGVQLMVAKEKRRFWIPAELAYGDTSKRPDAPSGPLTFDIELIDIMKVPTTPLDVAGPPPTAKKTASGLAYRALAPGKDKRQPKETDTVEVSYTGWTTDGQVFDSTMARGQPATVPVKGTHKGWTEALQLMHVGEKMRFWIPANLAYGEKTDGGGPSGMLVYDIEILALR